MSSGWVFFTPLSGPHLAMTFDRNPIVGYKAGMKIVTRLFVLLPLLWVERVWAVDCPSGSYQLTTQSDVSALGAANCDTVTGNLIIGASSDIYNLDSLTSLRRVEGKLQVASNTGLLNVDGLLNVTEVVGALSVDNNTVLTNVDGLVGITSAGSLSVTSNPKLTQINGLSNLASTSGNVTVSSNALLQDVDGLSKLSAIGGALTIQNNAALTNIDGLAALRSVEVGVPGASYTVSASASTGGSISPASRTVETGQNARFTVINESGYFYNSMGGTCPAGYISGTTYTTGAITTNCTVEAQFIADSVNAEYCVGAPSDVYCNPTMQDNGSTTLGGTLDDWAALTGGKRYSTVPAGKIAALPFTANAIGKRGYLYFITNDTLPPAYQWRAWYSQTPGGQVMDGGTCEIRLNNPNPAQFYWSQLYNESRYVCDLGATERTIYFNMEVQCNEPDAGGCSLGDRYGTDYYIEIAQMIL